MFILCMAKKCRCGVCEEVFGSLSARRLHKEKYLDMRGGY